MSDPFTTYEAALLDLIKNSPSVSTETKNIRRMSNEVSQRLDTTSDSDVPEILQLGQSINVNVNFTSCSIDLTRAIALEVNTGSWDSSVLSGLHFAILATIAKAQKENSLRDLEWANKKYILSLGIESLNDGVSDPGANRSVIGWSSIWVITARMNFALEDLVLHSEGKL